MKGRSLEEWIDILGLEQVDDPQIQKPIYRKVSFGPMALTDEIEKLISSQFRELREMRDMPRTVLAPLLGLHHQVLSRYEKATSKLTVARLIHLCEVLDTSPIELLYPVAPHLFGDTAHEAEMTKSIFDKLRTLDAPTLAAISNFIQHLKTKPETIDDSDCQLAARAAS
ncbi:helix-turn-helix transcriptional regulator [Ochrobactrum sp. BD22]